ncbi:hypothetical protein TDB9533_02015 [Thalassocella blandensis]|nr:hypothetical protein TDB9533_02015 [Thalassocella blandensis]
MFTSQRYKILTVKISMCALSKVLSLFIDKMLAKSTFFYKKSDTRQGFLMF